MAKIIHIKKECIGCGSCEMLCPRFWKMGEDLKAMLKDAKETEDGNYELEVDSAGCNDNAADCCPVRVIKIVK